MLSDELFLTGEDFFKLLRLSSKTLQGYMDNGTTACCKIGGKIPYRHRYRQAMLKRHFIP